MALAPKTPLATRLKTLKEALLWVMGDRRERANRIRQLTMLAPGLAGIHQTTSKVDAENVGPVQLNEWALPLVDPQTLARWRKMSVQGRGREGRAELAKSDVRWGYLVQVKADFYGAEGARLEGLTRTAIRMAWKNATQDRHLLAMANYVLSQQQLPELEQTQLEMAMSLEEPMPTPTTTEFAQRWKELNNKDKAYLVALARAVNMDLTEIPESELTQLEMEQVINKTGLTWLSWNSLFNQPSEVEKILSSGVRVEQLSGLSNGFTKQIEQELQRWQELARSSYKTVPSDHEEDDATDQDSDTEENKKKITEWLPASINPITNQELAYKDKEVSALHWAFLLGSTQAIDVLLKYGANPNIALNQRSANGLSLALMRSEWELTLKLLKAGCKANWQAIPLRENDKTEAWFYAECPIFCVARTSASEELEVKTLKALCEKFNQESPQATPEWVATYHQIVTDNKVNNFNILLHDRSRQHNYFAPNGWGPQEQGDAWMLFEGEKGPKIELLKALGHQDININEHAWYHSEHGYSTWMVWPLLAWAPEALEEWLKLSINQKLLPLLFKEGRATGWGATITPKEWRQRVQTKWAWTKGDNHWTVAVNSTNPKLALSLLKKHLAPTDCLYDKAKGDKPRDIWETALIRKSDDYLVTWICKELGGPKWEPDYIVAEYAKWTTAPRNEVEIEQVLKLGVLPLNQPIDKDGDTILHKAISDGDQWLVQQWIEAGGDVDLANHSGVTPRQLAKQGGWGLDIIANAEKLRLQQNLPTQDVPSNKKHL